MIGKVITGKSFRGCLAYCLSDKKIVQPKRVGDIKKERAEVLFHNQCCGDKKELSRQFEEVRRLNPRQGKPVLHITLSMAPVEHLDRGDLIKLVEACARHMGFDKNQYVAVEHLDTRHQHLHIVANRVGYDGLVVSDSNSYKRIADFCRKMEKEMGLKQVLSPKRFLPKHLRDLPRHDWRKKALKQNLQLKLFNVSNYAAFEREMKELGYRVERGRGIAFIDEKGVRIKGSEVDYPLARIERILKQNENGLAIKKGEERGAMTVSPQLQNSSDRSQDHKPAPTKNLLATLLKVQQESFDIPPWLLSQKKKKKTKRPRL